MSQRVHIRSWWAQGEVRVCYKGQEIFFYVFTEAEKQSFRAGKLSVDEEARLRAKASSLADQLAELFNAYGMECSTVEHLT